MLIRYILTCGSDGDVRIWEGAEDDDAISHGTGDKAFCVAYKVLNKFHTSIKQISKNYFLLKLKHLQVIEHVRVIHARGKP